MYQSSIYLQWAIRHNASAALSLPTRAVPYHGWDIQTTWCFATSCIYSVISGRYILGSGTFGEPCRAKFGYKQAILSTHMCYIAIYSAQHSIRIAIPEPCCATGGICEPFISTHMRCLASSPPNASCHAGLMPSQCVIGCVVPWVLVSEAQPPQQ